MATKRPLDERIQDAEKRLLQLKAQEKLKQQREKKKAAQVEKRRKLAEAWQLTREQDAHRKIQLGGVVIAAGADHLDPAELCGILLVALRNLTPAQLPALKEKGLAHFANRKAAKEAK